MSGENISLDRKINETNPIQPYYLWYQYIESGRTTSIGNRIAVSAWVSCPSGGSNCSITSSTGWSVSASYSAGISTSAAKSAVQGSASFTWNTTASRSTSYTIPIQPGKRGRMMFFPEFNYTYGTLRTWSGSTILETKSVNAQSPKKVVGTGDPDGTFFIEYSN
ncbi:DUF6060 domain-containing protein [Bacillus timonensis]|uniref:DUF6060 domain-containing protein n=1 Tax=Bacillus timonensis TaxID=1033734 RepID=UPI001CA368E2